MCDCENWKSGIKQLNGILHLYMIRGGSLDGQVPFEYCPWCGEKLKVVNR